MSKVTDLNRHERHQVRASIRQTLTTKDGAVVVKAHVNRDAMPGLKRLRNTSNRKLLDKCSNCGHNRYSPCGCQKSKKAARKA